MWSFGSIRDSIRENARVAHETAKAAAQVAQGVLQAAAAENDDQGLEQFQPDSIEHNPVNNWDVWSGSRQGDAPLSHSTSDVVDCKVPPSASQASQSGSFPPPPPLTDTSSASLGPISGLLPQPNKQRRAHSSRYVVTGVNTTLSNTETGLQVPQPQPLGLTPQSNSLYDVEHEVAFETASHSLPSPPFPPSSLQQSGIEHEKTKQHQDSLKEDSNITSFTSPKSEPADGHAPWDFEEDNWKGDKNGFVVDQHFASPNSSVQQSATIETNVVDPFPDDPRGLHDKEMNKLTIGPSPDPFRPHVEQSVEDTANEDKSAFDFLSHRSDDGKGEFAIGPQPDMVHPTVEQNGEGRVDDDSSAFDLLSEYQRSNNQDVLLQGGILQPVPLTSSNDCFSESSGHTRDPIPSAAKGKNTNGEFDEESTDWFDKTASQLEKISKSFGESGACTSGTCFSGNEEACIGLSEDVWHERSDLNPQSSSFRIKGFEAKTPTPNTEALAPTMQISETTGPPATSRDFQIHEGQPFRPLSSTFEFVVAEAGAAPLGEMSASEENSDQRTGSIPCREGSRNSIVEPHFEPEAGQEALKVESDNRAAVEMDNQFSFKGESTELSIGTSTSEKAIGTDDINWFSDHPNLEHESVKNTFSEIINKVTPECIETELPYQVSSASERENASSTRPPCADNDNRKAGVNSGACCDEQYPTRSTFDDAPGFWPFAPYSNSTSLNPSSKPLSTPGNFGLDSSEPRALCFSEQSDSVLSSDQKKGNSEQGGQGFNPDANLDGFNHVPESVSSELVADCAVNFPVAILHAQETSPSGMSEKNCDTDVKVQDVEIDVSISKKLTSPTLHDRNSSSARSVYNEEKREHETEVNENDMKTGQCAVNEFQPEKEEHMDRAALLKRVNELEDLLGRSRSELNAKESEINQRLEVAETDAEITKFEFQKMAETCDMLRNEVSNLHCAEVERTKALAVSHSKLKELELQLQFSAHHKDEGATPTNPSSEQYEEQVGRLQEVIDEKRSLFDDRKRLENEKDVLQTQFTELNKQLSDLQREVLSLTNERDELKVNCDGMYTQLNENQKQAEAVMKERDRLIHERSSYASTSASAREKSLAVECEHRVRALALAQKKVASATSKIEKLTSQRNTFQRQRDDAGARLRAAGAEFTSLNSKLSETIMIKEDLQAQTLALREERDKFLAKIQGFAATEAEFKVNKERLRAGEKELALAKNILKECQEKHHSVIEERSSLQLECEDLKGQLHTTLGVCEVANRKIEIMKSRIEEYEQKFIGMRNEIQILESYKAELESKNRELKSDVMLLKDEKVEAILSAEKMIAKEQEERREAEDRLGAMDRRISDCNENMEGIRNAITSCLNLGKVLLGDSPSNGGFELVWPESLTFGEGYDEVHKAATTLCEVTRILCEEYAKSNGSRKELESKYSDTSEQLQRVTSELLTARKLADEVANARCEADEARRDVELLKSEKREREIGYAELQQQLEVALNKEGELLHQLNSLGEEFRLEREKTGNRWSKAKAEADEISDRVLSKLRSVWGMLEKCIGEEQAQILYEELSHDEDSESNSMEVITLRGTALVVAELNRRRAEASDMVRRLESVDAEVARLTDRSELAEQERDALIGAVDRVERKASNAHSVGQEEARVQFEKIVSQLEDELTELRDDLKISKEKSTRGDKEVGELRGLCNKLTTQLNSRTNELDEAEEKLAYMQDQVSTLEEDLQEAHRRLKRAEEESAEFRRFEVEKLSRELEKQSGELDSVEKECIRLREACDEAERKAKECEIEARTRRQAEENLQIAIEQLEAEQESAVEQRTIALEKKVRDSEVEMKEANERAREAVVSESQLKLRDDEIMELRGALGRLSDERVELKLELEKSLSRLHHPDAEEQLVDRRVVRQLLVSYFRVDSVRRRDVLQLMSRMLAFSESDDVAVGLKRRALIDRLGSLVQAPELDDAALPPLGTVSDKWIEFLMKEAEEGEDQERRW